MDPSGHEKYASASLNRAAGRPVLSVTTVTVLPVAGPKRWSF
ncbi:hypothetical protein [Streptomyces sp. NPDC052721]